MSCSDRAASMVRDTNRSASRGNAYWSSCTRWGYGRAGLVFFSSRRRHTRYWRDWSSDVCSSDLFKENAEVDLQELTGFLLNQVLMIYVATEELGDAFRLFTILNNRGMPLRNSDILRSEERRVGKECRSRWSRYH